MPEKKHDPEKFEAYLGNKPLGGFAEGVDFAVEKNPYINFLGKVNMSEKKPIPGRVYIDFGFLPNCRHTVEPIDFPDSAYPFTEVKKEDYKVLDDLKELENRKLLKEKN